MSEGQEPYDDSKAWWYEDGKIHCPKCGEVTACVATAYGFRACCSECRIRWTRIRGEADWTAEPYSPLEDNRNGVDGENVRDGQS